MNRRYGISYSYVALIIWHLLDVYKKRQIICHISCCSCSPVVGPSSTESIPFSWFRLSRLWGWVFWEASSEIRTALRYSILLSGCQIRESVGHSRNLDKTYSCKPDIGGWSFQVPICSHRRDGTTPRAINIVGILISLPSILQRIVYEGGTVYFALHCSPNPSHSYEMIASAGRGKQDVCTNHNIQTILSTLCSVVVHHSHLSRPSWGPWTHAQKVSSTSQTPLRWCTTPVRDTRFALKVRLDTWHSSSSFDERSRVPGQEWWLSPNVPFCKSLGVLGKDKASGSLIEHENQRWKW